MQPRRHGGAKVARSLALVIAGCAGEKESVGEGDGVWGELGLGEAQECAVPVEAAWVDEAEARGLSGRSVPGDHLEGGAMAWADFDGDGIEDLLIFYNGEGATLYRWPEGQPPQRTPFQADAWGPLWVERGSGGDGGQGAGWELWLGGANPAILGWNGVMFEYLELPPLPDWFVIGVSSTKQFVPAYIDDDDILDMFVLVNAGTAVRDDPAIGDFVLLGTAEGGWELGGDLGLAGRRRGFDAAWVPPVGEGAGGDGGAEGEALLHRIYVANDMGPDFGGNVMWAREEGYLLERTGHCQCGAVQSFMGTQVADVDGDQIYDILLSGTGGNQLLQGMADGTFVDVTASTGFNTITDRLGMAWGMAAEDLDNDGQREILVLQGDFWGGSMQNPYVVDWPVNLLRWEGAGGESGAGETGAGQWVDVAAEIGLPQAGSFRSALPRDVNRDGVLDLLISEVDARPHWFISQGCTAAGWLEIEGPEGTWVEVEAGGRTQVARLTADVSYGVTARPLAHLGLGEAQVVERLTAHLPDGRVVEGGGFAGRRLVRVE